MAIAKGQEAMNKLIDEYQKTVNKFFEEQATEMFEIKKKELIAELDKKKGEIILQMVRDISRRYNVMSMGETLTITINEGPIK